MNKLLGAAAALALVASAGSAMAANYSPGNPASADGTASVQVVTLLTLTKTTDLNFGKITSDATNAGTVSLTADATATPTAGGGVALVSGTTRTAAKFHIAGDATQAYTVTVPPSIANLGAVSGLTVTTSTSTLPTSGPNDFYVAGSLAVPANTAAGSYQATFTVSAAYN